MSPVEYGAFWTTVFLYMVGSGLAITGLVFRKEGLVTAGAWACGAGLAAHLAAVGARIAYTGHLPVASRYENVLTGAAVVMIFCLAAILRRRGLRPLVAFAAPFTLLMLGYGFLNQPAYTTMSLVLDNLWMFVHVFFAWLAYGAYVVAAAIGGLYLLRVRRPREGKGQEEPSHLIGRLPSPEVMDDLVFRFITLGFVAHVVMLVSGSIWARDLWGSYWNWDPVETWSLLSGLLYGLWIHLRLTLGWKGRRTAWLAVLFLVTVLIAFWGTSLFGITSHSLDDLRLRIPAEGADPQGP